MAKSEHSENVKSHFEALSEATKRLNNLLAKNGATIEHIYRTLSMPEDPPPPPQADATYFGVNALSRITDCYEAAQRDERVLHKILDTLSRLRLTTYEGKVKREI